MEKTCPQCRETKPLSEFKYYPQLKAKYSKKCKQCSYKGDGSRRLSKEMAERGFYRCSKCKEWKKRESFFENKYGAYGVQSQCKFCITKNKGRYLRTMIQDDMFEMGYLWCGACKIWKTTDCFRKNSFMKYGYQNICKPCKNEVDAIYIENHKDRVKVWRAEYARRPNQKESRARYKRENKDKVNSWTQRRRANARGNGGSYTMDQWVALIEHYSPENKCLCCGKATKKLTPDHIFPVSLGGDSFITNIQPLCSSCNHKKRAKFIDYRPDGGRFAQLLMVSP